MTYETLGLPDILQNNLVCQVIRVLLASRTPCDIAEISERTSAPHSDVLEALGALEHHAITESRDGMYLIGTPGKNHPDVRHAIERYENRILRERALHPWIDVPSRFRVTEALYEAITHARASLK